jgi:uncharacterized protein
MSQFPDSSTGRKPFDLECGVSEGAVFNFFNGVYAWMCAAMAVTATTAWVTAQNYSMLGFLYQRGVSLVLMLGLVLAVYAIRTAAYRINATVATLMFIGYAALVGMAISGIFVVYKLSSIGGVFVVTAGMFGGMSVYGYVTRRDLSSMGSLCIMAVWGIFLAALVNIFLQSAGFSWLLSLLCVPVFVILTAYDTQKLRQIAQQTEGNPDMAGRMQVLGSLELYLDFLNLFLSLLRLLGSRK